MGEFRSDACKFAPMNVHEMTNSMAAALAHRYDQAEARAIASALLMHHFKGNPGTWATSQRVPIDEQTEHQIVQQVERVLQGEPLQYVLQTAWFCNLQFSVGPGVLIPRPETEELVEWIISECRSLAQPLQLLDIGTGSGCIAIALKKRLPTSEVWALDKSEEAIQYARTNAKQLEASLALLHMDLFEEKEWTHLPAMDIVVSNPPYIASHEAALLAEHVRAHEPALALFAPATDPLHYYKKILQLFIAKRKEKGQLFCEINPLFANELVSLFEQSGLCAAIKKDMQGKDRMIRGWID